MTTFASSSRGGSLLIIPESWGVTVLTTRPELTGRLLLIKVAFPSFEVLKTHHIIKSRAGDFDSFLGVNLAVLWQNALPRTVSKQNFIGPVLDDFPMSFDLCAPHNQRRRSFVFSIIEHVKISYYQYEVIFPLYAMSPGEQLAFTYLPPLGFVASRRASWLGKSAENQLLPLTWKILLRYMCVGRGPCDDCSVSIFCAVLAVDH